MWTMALSNIISKIQSGITSVLFLQRQRTVCLFLIHRFVIRVLWCWLSFLISFSPRNKLIDWLFFLCDENIIGISVPSFSSATTQGGEKCASLSPREPFCDYHNISIFICDMDKTEGTPNWLLKGIVGNVGFSQERNHIAADDLDRCCEFRF